MRPRARIGGSTTKTCNLYKNFSGAWVAVTDVGTLADAPQTVQQENNFFLSDGVSNWMFDGTHWTPVGFKIPQNIPAINVVNGSPTALFGPNPTGDTNPVTAFLLNSNDTNHHGDFNLAFGQFTVNPGPPITIVGIPKATGNSVLFNPPQLTGSPDPNSQPISPPPVVPPPSA